MGMAIDLALVSGLSAYRCSKLCLHVIAHGFDTVVVNSITVAALDQHQESSSESSLASSSIVMPQSAPFPSSNVSEQAMRDSVELSSAMSSSPITAPSKPPSDTGTDSDSVSLISIPSDDDDDESAWEDSRSHVMVTPPAEGVARGMEYVVLYDSSSDEE